MRSLYAIIHVYPKCSREKLMELHVNLKLVINTHIMRRFSFQTDSKSKDKEYTLYMCMYCCTIYKDMAGAMYKYNMGRDSQT